MEICCYTYKRVLVRNMNGKKVYKWKFIRGEEFNKFCEEYAMKKGKEVNDNEKNSE